jgi:hypothetical protein
LRKWLQLKLLRLGHRTKPTFDDRMLKIDRISGYRAKRQKLQQNIRIFGKKTEITTFLDFSKHFCVFPACFKRSKRLNFQLWSDLMWNSLTRVKDFSLTLNVGNLSWEFKHY